MTEILSPEKLTAACLAVAPRIGAVTAPAVPAAPTAEPPPVVAPVTHGPAPIDKAGRLFDPKHYRANADGSPFLNAKGYFMPRGGRKAKTAGPVVTASAAPIAAPAVPLPPAVDAWSASDRATAAGVPSGQPGEPGEAAGPSAAGQAAPPVGKSSDAAEVGCRAVYTAAGLVFGAPDEATPPPAEHKNYVEAAAAYIDYRGWKFVGGLALVVCALAYLLRMASKPKTEARIKKWTGFGEEPRNVTPAPASKAEADEPPPAPPPVAAVPPVSIAPQTSVFTRPFVPPSP